MLDWRVSCFSPIGLYNFRGMLISSMTLQEPKDFTDFLFQLNAHPELLVCPVCSGKVYSRILNSFNLNRTGVASFECYRLDCDFNRMRFRVVAGGV